MFRRVFFVLCFWALLPLPYAQAQFSQEQAMPLSLTADSAFTENGVTTLIGGVDIEQGEARIRADKMEIFFADKSEEGVSSADDVFRIVATGNFLYITPEQEVSGDKGVYEQDKDIFIVTGDVTLTRGEGNQVKSARMVYDLVKKTVRFGETCVGEKCEDRVRVVLE